MNRISTNAITSLLAVAVVGMAVATAHTSPKPESTAETCFAKIKSLAGDWYQKDEKSGKEMLVLRYRVVSAGSAVEESIMPGQPHEMISMYHMEGGSLAMTHYCSLGNQPHMVATSSSTPEKIVFDCSSVGNSKSHNDMHMHHAVLMIKDSSHLAADWASMQNGKTGFTAKFEAYRKDSK